MVGDGLGSNVGDGLGNGLGDGLGNGLGEGDGLGIGDGLTVGTCVGVGETTGFKLGCNNCRLNSSQSGSSVDISGALGSDNLVDLITSCVMSDALSFPRGDGTRFNNRCISSAKSLLFAASSLIRSNASCSPVFRLGEYSSVAAAAPTRANISVPSPLAKSIIFPHTDLCIVGSFAAS